MLQRRLAGGGSQREARVDRARRAAELGGLSVACGRAECRRGPVWRRSGGRLGGEARAAGWRAEHGGQSAERGGRGERGLQAGGPTAARRLSVVSTVAAPHHPRCAILAVPLPVPPLLPFTVAHLPSSVVMSQASSSTARTRRSSAARVALQPGPLAVVAAVPPPTAVDLQAPLDDMTGLPLIMCPTCKDVRVFAATTTKSQYNIGKRFFKCPRQGYGNVSSVVP